MLRQIRKIEGIGQFYGYVTKGDFNFKKVNLIYALNGYGKSTFTDIFRSLANNDSLILESKQSIRKGKKPECSMSFLEDPKGREDSVVYKDQKWSQTYTNIKVFDTKYISENVYSDFQISHQHKENLTTIILGDAGKKIAEKIKTLQKNIEEQKKIQKSKSDSIKALVPEMDVAKFLLISHADKVKIARKGDVEAKIKVANEEQKVKQLEIPLGIQLPSKLVDLLAGLESTFNLTELSGEKITEEIIQKIEKHKRDHLDIYGEDWLKKGVQYTQGGICPYCTQDTFNVKDVISSYKTYFSKAYSDLIEIISSGLSEFEESTNSYSVFINNIDGRIAKNTTCLQGTKDYVKPEEFINTELFLKDKANQLIDQARKMSSAVEDLGKTMKKSIGEKRQKPLTKVVSTLDRFKLIDIETKLETALAEYNSEVEKLSLKIKALKTQGSDGELLKLQKELVEINNIDKRFSSDGNLLCTEINLANIEEKRLEKEKTVAETELSDHNNSVAKTYLKKVNELLVDFNCRFSIKPPITMSKRGNTPVIDVGFSLLGEDFESKRFGDLLSESDKRALAFSFFLAQLLLHNPQELSKTIVVIDDPFTSLDDNRIFTTCLQLSKLEKKVAQLIILSHYALPLSSLIQNYPEALQLKIVNDDKTGSYLVKEDLGDLRNNDHEKRLQRLDKAKTGNILDEDISEIKGAVRLVIEHEISTRFRPHFNGGDTKTLGAKISILETAYKSGKLSFKIDGEDVLNELRFINGYVSEEHHPQTGEIPFVDNLKNLVGLITTCESLIYNKL